MLLHSAFFARPITISLVFAQTTPSSPLATQLSPTPLHPTVQKRQVNLLCEGRALCYATSAVRITNAQCAELFLQEGYAIGQIFRKLGAVPQFELIEAGLIGDEDVEYKTLKDKRKMWRRYTLKIDGFEADIVEVFPDRDMFTLGEAWLFPSSSLSPEKLGQHPSIDGKDGLLSMDEPGPWTPCLSAQSIAFSERGLYDNHERSPGTPSSVAFDLPEELERRGEGEDLRGTVVSALTGRAEGWADSNSGLLRFMAVFLAVLMLLVVPRDSSDTRLF